MAVMSPGARKATGGAEENQPQDMQRGCAQVCCSHEEVSCSAPLGPGLHSRSLVQLPLSEQKWLLGRGKKSERKGEKERRVREIRGRTTLSTLSFVPRMRRHEEKAAPVEGGGDASGSPASAGPTQKDMGKGKS